MMPEMQIEVGGKPFTVACEDGQEAYLRAAAEMLDREAQALVATGAKLSTDRMLLMAGLMLADRAASSDEELRAMDRRLAQQSQQLDAMQAAADAPPKEVEVVREVVPDAAVARLEALVARAEGLARDGGAADI